MVNVDDLVDMIDSRGIAEVIEQVNPETIDDGELSRLFRVAKNAMAKIEKIVAVHIGDDDGDEDDEDEYY